MVADFYRILDSSSRGEFLGRRAELTALDAVLERRPAEARLVAVTGPAGAGKTRLVAQWLEEVRTRGCTVAAGSAEHPASMTPSEVLTSSLDHCLRHAPESVFDGLGAEELSWLAGLFPVLRQRWTARWPSDPAEISHVFGLARALLVRLARERSLVLFCDDMHWADPVSLEFLRFLFLDPPKAAIVIVLGYRPAQAGPGLTELVERVVRYGAAIRIELGPLTEDQTAGLLPAGADRLTRRLLHHDSAGNPGVAQELARAHGPRPELGHHPHGDELRSGIPHFVVPPVPEMRRLSPAALLALCAAAVCGDPFDLTMVAFVAQVTGAEAQTVLDELAAEHLVLPAADGGLRLRDPVVRAAAYHAAAPGWRQSAHTRAALLLRLAGAAPARQACHLEHTAIAGDTAGARVLTAAARDTVFTAPARALRWLEVAARLRQAEPDPADVLTRATALALDGRPAEARTLLVGLRRQRAALPEELRAATAEWLARTERWLGLTAEADETAHGEPAAGAEPGLWSEQLAVAVDSGTAWARRPGTGAPVDALPAEPAHRARCLSLLAASAWLGGQRGTAEGRARRAAELVDGLDDAALTGGLETLRWLGSTEAALGRREEAERHLLRGHRLVGLHGQRVLQRGFAVALAELCLSHHDLEGAGRYAEEAEQCAAYGPVAATAAGRPTEDPQSPLKLLSQREEQIAQLVSQGRTNQQIARELGLSHKTVETYLGRTFKKLGISARAQVALLVGRAG
ncbi:AAA family ATPase [Kitasatospora sp. NPDC096147]|uniref:helix-turn-helix transcriptional regulator n=1 Tax=Kitasatospora sp. NPDC096147 TaxID=3364093 RepID=UPI00381B420C